MTEGSIQGSALEDLWEETQREYAALLRKELQPTLEYFELINEELMEEIPLAEEDDPNFQTSIILQPMTGRKATTCGSYLRFNNILPIGRCGPGCSST